MFIDFSSTDVDEFRSREEARTSLVSGLGRYGGSRGLAGVSGEAGRDGGGQLLERRSPDMDARAPAGEDCGQKDGAGEGAPHLSLRTRSLRSRASPAWLRRSPSS